MPRTLRGAVPRKNIRIPKPMMDEVERIVAGHPELYNNRQQFVESAIRERIERYVLGTPNASKNILEKPEKDNPSRDESETKRETAPSGFG